MVKTRILILIAILLFVAAATTSAVFFFLPKQSDGQIAVVTVDGETVYQVDLSEVDAPYQKEIVTKYGKNILLIKKGSISVFDADCENKECIKMGEIVSSAYPIVCLPHRLVIKIQKEGDVDAVSV